MSLIDQTREIQRLVGVTPDGAWGPETAGAVLRRLRSPSDGAGEPGGAMVGSASGSDAQGGAPDEPQGQNKAGGNPRVSQAGIDLIHSFEQCRLAAYPDPGSADGNPWTIGWGSTGPGIARGVVWTQQQADERFAADLRRFEDGMRIAVAGAPTTQNQFDALVSLAYNIGIKAAAGSTVMRRHREGDHEGAATAFGMWVKNDGAVMRGLVRRRAAEADHYRGQG